MTALRFHSEKFDYKSELPSNYNAGNRFYGRDLAEELSKALTESGHAASCYDEDWGWVVQSVTGPMTTLEIGIYNLSDHMEGGRPGAPEWGLWLHTYQKKKMLGFLSRTTEIEVPESQIDLVREVFQKLEIELEARADGPGSNS